MRSTSVLTKKPTSSSSALSVRPAIGPPIGNVVAGAKPGEQRRQPGLQHHEQARLAVARQTKQSAVQLRVDPQRHMAAPIARHRGPRPVGRQLDLIRKVLERLGPERELPRHGAVGIALRAQHLVLPQGVVGILHRQRRKRGALPSTRAPYATATSRHSGASDQPSPAMWCSSSSSTCSRSPSPNRCARSGGSVSRSKPCRAARGHGIL